MNPQGRASLSAVVGFIRAAASVWATATCVERGRQAAPASGFAPQLAGKTGGLDVVPRSDELRVPTPRLPAAASP